MAFSFADMATAVQTYPDTNVVIDIRDFDPVEGDSLNESEQATFKVRITNNGLLNMKAVTVRVKAENGATLKRPLDIPNGPSGPSVPTVGTAGAKAVVTDTTTELVSKPIASINANGGTGTTEVFTLNAPPDDTNGVSTKLLTVTLEGWDADLAHLLENKSTARTAVKDTHSEVVHPL